MSSQLYIFDENFFARFRGIFPIPVYNRVETVTKGGERMTEQEIIALIRSRDESGAEELLRHYGPLMRYIIAPILPNPQDQEECISEVAMRVWEKIESFQPDRGSWNAWLTVLTRNIALNRARQGRNQPSGEIPPETPSTEPSPEELLLRQERQEALNRALAQLSQRDKALFYRKYYYLQSTAQIAAELGLTLRAVEGRLYRLKQQLRSAMGGERHV